MKSNNETAEALSGQNLIPFAVAPNIEAESEVKGLHVAVNAYAKAASARAGRERTIGVAAAVASSVVSLSIFASLSASPNVWAKVATGMLAAATAALVAAEKFSGRASSTVLLRRAGDFAKLWYKLKLEGESALTAVCMQHAELIGADPAVDEKYWRAARKQVESHVVGA